MPIEDYALIGDTRSAALVSRRGSIDWLCWPRFDSTACFAALLGTPEHGRWLLAPSDPTADARRSYRGDSLVLETTYRTGEGEACVVDCMPLKDGQLLVLRSVVGLSGTVRMRCDFRPRFDYGGTSPTVNADGRRLTTRSDTETLTLTAGVPLDSPVTEFELGRGDRIDFVLAWSPHDRAAEQEPDPEGLISTTVDRWQRWADRCTYRGPYRSAVVRSLVTVNALVYSPTGGMIAAPTTSLPEVLGGERNWDYRFSWIRDSTLALLALVTAGYRREAEAWRDWLLRAVQGADRMQTMYDVGGDWKLPEQELDHLPGYAGSRPVRVGNAARPQVQLDAYGELMDTLHQARAHGIGPRRDVWQAQRELLDFLESAWREPDHGIWEIRGEAQHFTHSKVMAWTAIDRAIAGAERFDLPGPVDSWRRLRAEIFDEVCARGYDADRGTFTQAYGSGELDAALLRIPDTGFLPATDDRMLGTVAAVERALGEGGFLRRYRTTNGENLDDLAGKEGAFLPCTCWLADNYARQGRADEAHALLRRVLAVRNDVGLLSEEYDVAGRRLLGNFPQALSHLSLVNAAFLLERRDRRARARR